MNSCVSGRRRRKTIVFVTHSIEEAAFLGDRVAVLTANPGTLREIVKIDLPRPRHNSDIRSSAEFGWVRHKIWELLQNHQPETRVSLDTTAGCRCHFAVGSSVARGNPMPNIPDILKRWLLRSSGVMVFLLLWEISPRLEWIDPYFLLPFPPLWWR